MIMNPPSSFPAVPTSSNTNMNNFIMQPQYINHKVGFRENNISASAAESSCASSASTLATFPMKLHAMLTDAAPMRFDDVVCWLPGGQAFKVLDPKRFSEQIMPQYFNQTKYKSFQRQLNIYGFQRVHHGPHKGGYMHKFCVHGYPELCEQIKREGTGLAQDVIAVSAATAAAEAAPGNKQPSPVSQAPLVDPIQPFAWDVETEAAFEDSSSDLFQSTVDEVAAFASSMMPNASEMIDPTPLPHTSQQQRPYQQQPQSSVMPPQHQGQPAFVKCGATSWSNTVLNSDDISFFKNLFQPGDSNQEKEILDGFVLASEQRRQQHQKPAVQQELQPQPQIYHPALVQQFRAAAPMPVPQQSIAQQKQKTQQHAVQQDQAPLLTSAAISEYNFPRKLYRLLQDCESNAEYRSIVSWSQDGTTFKVHCKKRFVTTILPNYFDQTQYASFRRQLNMYSFLRQSMSTYANPYFKRGHRELLDHVVRKNGSGSTSTKKN